MEEGTHTDLLATSTIPRRQRKTKSEQYHEDPYTVFSPAKMIRDISFNRAQKPVFSISEHSYFLSDASLTRSMPLTMK